MARELHEVISINTGQYRFFTRTSPEDAMSPTSVGLFAGVLVVLLAVSQIALLWWVARAARTVSEVVARDEAEVAADEPTVPRERLAA